MSVCDVSVDRRELIACVIPVGCRLQSGMVKVELRPDDIRKEGWINKESAVLRTYRRRWLVLTPERLYSFKSERKYADPTEVPSRTTWPA